jgi:hypothetical protein
VTGRRSTSTQTVAEQRERTAAATAARRATKVSNLALEVACRVGDLEDTRLAVLTGLLLTECGRRRIHPFQGA